MLTTHDYLTTANIFTAKKKYMPILACVACNGEIRSTDLETSYVAHAIPHINGCFDVAQIKLIKSGITPHSNIDLSEFPNCIPEISYEPTSWTNAGYLLPLLKRALVCSSSDPTRYQVNSVAFDNRDAGKSYLVSTDGHRLYYAALACPIKLYAQDALVPNDGVAKLVKVLSKRSSDTDISLSFSETYLRVGIGELETVYIRLLDGQFPNWRMITGDEDERRTGSAYVNREKLLAQVMSIQPALTDSNKAIRIYITDHQMTITASSPEYGKVRANLRIDKAGMHKVFGISSNYLVEFLKSVKCSEILFSWRKGDAQLFFRDPSAINEVVSIMSMRFK